MRIVSKSDSISIAVETMFHRKFSLLRVKLIQLRTQLKVFLNLSILIPSERDVKLKLKLREISRMPRE